MRFFNKILLLAAGLTASVLYADLPFVYRSVNNAPALRVAPNPAKLNGLPQQMVNNVKVTAIAPTVAGKTVTAYNYITGVFKRYPAPGTLIFSWRADYPENVDKNTVSMNFNLPKGPNGSAGKASFAVKSEKGMRDYSQAFTVPYDTAAAQYVLSFQANDAVNVEKIIVEYAPDHIKTASFTPDPNMPPTQWRVQQGDCFFDPASLKVATVRTAVKLSWDKENLYIGFIADEPDMRNISQKVTRRDGPLWNDDCVEFFFYDPRRDVAKQFIVNPANTQFDCERRQAQPGDPYKDHPWDGKWQSRIWKMSNRWQAAMVIPWKTLGFDTVPSYPVRVNFARERFQGGMLSHWNCYSGSFAEVENFAVLDFKSGSIQRSRKAAKISYTPARSRKVFDGLVKKEPYHWGGWSWSIEFNYNAHEPAVRKKYTLEQFADYQKMLLENWSKAQISSVRLDLLLNSKTPQTILPFEFFAELTAKHDLRYPYIYGTNSTMLAKQGVMPSIPANIPGLPGRKHIDPALPESADYVINDRFPLIARQLKERPELRNMIAYLQGFDEPCNHIRLLYSRTRNAEQKAWLDEFEKRLKNDTGFGKFGLHDDYGKVNDDDAFRRIAFWRWWNRNFAQYTKRIKAAADKMLPGIPLQVFNRNSCAANDQIDIALCGNDDFIISCDPYPTSARAQFGMGRALYHTGFSVKILRDLAPKAKIAMFGQCFNYWQGVPTRSEVTEWTSQALKNGLQQLRWYGSGVITRNKDLNSEVYNAMLEIQQTVSKFQPLELPQETHTAIYYSDYDRWGLDERPTHAAYTVYALLAEHINCNFRFVSRNNLNLDNIRLLYIPRMRFTDPELTARIMEFVKNGGTAVIFDPDFMKFNIDGSSVPERKILLGTELIKKTVPGNYLICGRNKLSLSKVKHAKSPENETLHAFDLAALPAGAKVLAYYQDKKPALVERAFGKGKVICSAVMPFGSSEAALTPGGWKEFVRSQARAVGEKMDLDIWFFALPETTGKAFRVKQLR